MIHARLECPVNTEGDLGELAFVLAVTNQTLDLHVRALRFRRDKELHVDLAVIKDTRRHLVARDLEVEVEHVGGPSSLGRLYFPDGYTIVARSDSARAGNVPATSRRNVLNRRVVVMHLRAHDGVALVSGRGRARRRLPIVVFEARALLDPLRSTTQVVAKSFAPR
jgi:hypothetical protein